MSKCNIHEIHERHVCSLKPTTPPSTPVMYLQYFVTHTSSLNPRILIPYIPMWICLGALSFIKLCIVRSVMRAKWKWCVLGSCCQMEVTWYWRINQWSNPFIVAGVRKDWEKHNNGVARHWWISPDWGQRGMTAWVLIEIAFRILQVRICCHGKKAAIHFDLWDNSYRHSIIFAGREQSY